MNRTLSLTIALGASALLPALLGAQSQTRPWYERYGLRGYVQLRYNRLLETNPRLGCQACDRSLGANNGAIRLTTARYYTPNGRSIQAQGISPDIVVSDVVPDSKGKVAPRFMREKDLDHHLQGEGEKGVPEKPAEPGKKPEAGAAKPSEDPPLDRALELLKTWQILNKVAKKPA